MAEITRAFEVINGMVEAGVIRQYAVAGAVAALNYIEPTVTEDLDVLIALEDFGSPTSGIVTLGPLLSYLANLGYSEFKKEGIVIDGWPVQFLPVANSLDAESLEQAIEVEVQTDGGGGPLRVKIMSAEHLVAIALKVGRAKDRERILRFVDAKALDWDRLKGVLERHDLMTDWNKFRTDNGIADLE